MSLKLLRMFSLLLTLVVIIFGVIGHIQAADMELLGAGATFPQPLYSKMFDAYYQQYKVKINYQGIGSGGGINQLIKKTVDFGGTDAFMTDAELKSAGAPVLHVPTCLGAVVLAYNLPGNPKLNLTSDIIAGIFLGTIKKWNDPKIVAINPGTGLPGLAITPVHRADSSGTTFIFTEYLAKTNDEWKGKIGLGKSVQWPAGLIGQKGNPGVAGYVKQTPGAIGYVELLYAIQNKMAYGNVKNKAGKFIEPTLKSVTAAANVKIPDDTHISLTNTGAVEGYPISSFTWLIFYKEQNIGGKTKERAEALAKMLIWMVGNGQRYVEPLQYSPLSKEAAAKSVKIISSMTYNGTQLLK